MRAKLRAMERVLNHPTLSAVSNVASAIPLAIFLGAIALAAIGRLLDQPALFLVAIIMAAVGLGLVAVIHFHRRRQNIPASTALTTQERTPAPAPFSHIHQADKALQAIRERFDEANRRKLVLIEAELVEMIDEGERLRGNEFSGNPTFAEFDAWQGPATDFVETVFGRTEKQRLLEVKSNGHEVRGHIAAVLDWLRALRDRPDSWQVQVDGPETEAAIKARRRPSLAEALTSLMREGIKLVTELSASVELEPIQGGGVKVSGGDAPEEWQDKADTFRQKAWSLLAERDPALLKVYEDACNAEIQKAREAENVSSDQAETSDKRSGLERALDMANWQRGGPKWEVEITLDGLSAAKLRLADPARPQVMA